MVVNNKPLALMDEVDILREYENEYVCDLILPNHKLNVDKLKEILPEDVINEVRGILVASKEEMPDSLRWDLLGTSSFTVKSAYKSVAGNYLKEESLT